MLARIIDPVSKPEEAVWPSKATYTPAWSITRTLRLDGGHPTVVLAVCRWIEATTGWSIRKFVNTARRYRTVET